MNLLLYQDVICHYLNTVGKERKEKDFIIKKILENEKSILVISKKLLEFIKSGVDENLYQQFIVKLNYLREYGLVLNVKSSESSHSFDQELLHLFDCLNKDLTLKVKLLFTICLDQPNSTVSGTITNVGVINKLKKPNFHWLVITTAMYHPNKVTVSCHDFSSDHEVDLFFDYVFKLPQKISEVNVFDRNCNFGHKKFRSFAKKHYVNYYTAKFKDITKNIDTKDDIKKVFGGKSQMHVAFLKKTHGRRIIFENLILSTDEDFQNLSVDGSDWAIDVQLCGVESANWLKRRSLYKKF